MTMYRMLHMSVELVPIGNKRQIVQPEANHNKRDYL
jgi:hypothetical protein